MTRSISRRQALSTVSAAGVAALLVGCGDDSDGSTTATTTSRPPTTGGDTETPAEASGLADQFEDAATCSLTPEEIEGPYYLDVDLVRSDIREEREGAVLRLGIRVLDEACEPVPDALVEVWHCDALGTYSGFEEASESANRENGQPEGAGGDPAEPDDTTYLRGGQVTGSDGIVEFTTIYPGWYRGRTVHIHSKVHLDSSERLTTQLYFDDDLSSAIFEQAPYDGHSGRDVSNDDDGFFLPETVLTVTEDGDGYLGLITYSIER